MVLDTSFKIIREVARGSGGIVYEAFDKLRGQKIALKVTPILPEYEYLGNLLSNEFSILNKLRHPHLARVFDFGKEEKKFYFSAEWIEGPSLLKFSEESNLNTLFELLIQILRGLDHLHQRGFLHLDIKPGNILILSPQIDQTLCCKLIDFGLSQLKEKFQTNKEFVYGTPPYSAPEMLLGEKASPATDLYSFGILCYQLLTKKFPFQSTSPAQIIQEQISQDLRIPEVLGPSLPKSFSKVIEKLLSRKAKQRYQSAQEVIHAFNESLEENFTLLPTIAPHSFLEESSRIFRKNLFDKIFSIIEKNPKTKISIEGKRGLGKSRLLQFLKAKLQVAGKQTEGEKAYKPFPTKKFTLQPLTKNELKKWATNEIQKIPKKILSTLHQTSRGIPTQIEEDLQILKTQGFIQWGIHGWYWRGPTQISWKKIFASHQKYWKEKLKRIQEVLTLSPQGLNSQIIAGLLQVEENEISKKLQDWVQQKCLLSTRRENLEVYYMPSTTKRQAPPLSKSMRSIIKQMKKLYDEDKFNEACQWLDWMETQTLLQKKWPEELTLIAARHRVAHGQSQKSLALLKNNTFKNNLKGMYYETLARCYLLEGNTEQAQNKLKHMKEHIHDPESKIRLLNLEGKRCKLLGQFQEAEAKFLEGIGLTKRKKNPYLLGTLFMNLGTLYQDEGHFEKASTFYEKALQETKKTKHPILLCILHQNLAYLAYQLGRNRQAEKHAFSCLELAFKNRFPEQQAIALNFLALFEGEKENNKRQLHYLEEAIHLLDSIPTSPWLCECLLHRAHVYWNLKKYFPAQLDTEKCLELSILQQDKRREATARFLLGKIFRDRENPDFNKSEEQFKSSFHLAEQSRHYPLIWEIHFEKGLLEQSRNNLEKAQIELASAQQSLKKLIDNIPEKIRWAYLKDRKLDKIENTLEKIRQKTAQAGVA